MSAFLSELSTDEIQECAKQLEGVLDSHAKWLARLNETIICRLAPSADDMVEDAHCRCHFGQWYHSSHHHILERSPEFLEIGEIHLSNSAQHFPLVSVQPFPLVRKRPINNALVA